MAPPSDHEGPGAADEAFGLLADETRLAILRALWDVEAAGTGVPVRFSDLRERLDVEDPGRLNYHLSKLSTSFVRRTDEGYELRDAGKRIVRILLSGTAIEDPGVDPVPVDIACWYCGGQPEWSYRDGWRYLTCTECDARCIDSVAPGVISKSEFPPSGLRGRTPNEINEADRIWGAHRRATVLDGVCPECAGPMAIQSVEICSDHRPDWEEYQFCEGCGSIFEMLVSHVCEVCRYRWRLPTLFYPSREPAVVAFYHDHGVEFDLAANEQRSLLLEYRESVVAEDPLRLRIAIPLDDEELRVTYDEAMTVRDIERRTVG